MTILPRYFLRVYLPLFGLCLFVFAGVLLMNHFLKLFNMAVMKGISPLWIAGCFARLLPFVLSLAIPMAFLVSLVLTLGQLAEGGEVMALRASGFSFAEITWPFLAVAALLSGFLLYLNHKASPEGFHSFRNRTTEAAQKVARIEIEAGSFVKVGPWRLFAKGVDAGSGRLEGVYLIGREPARLGMRVSAPRGRILLDPGRGASLELEEGELQLPNPEPEKLTSGSFRSYRVEVPLAGRRVDRSPDMQELSSGRLKELGRDPQVTPQHRVEYAVEIAVRSAAAFSPFVFFWIAAPLGLGLKGTRRGAGLALSLVILFAFYGLLAVGIGLGRRHEALASLAPWLADAVGLAIGAAMTRRSLAA